MARIYTKHQLTPVIATLRLRGISAVDGRTALGRAVKAWRRSQEAHLGAKLTPPVVSILDHAEVTKLLVASIDAFLVADPSHVVNRKRRTLTPIALQRQGLVESHRRDMLALGLDHAAALGETEGEIIAAVRRDLRARRKARPPRDGIRNLAQDGRAASETTVTPSPTEPAPPDGTAPPTRAA